MIEGDVMPRARIKRKPTRKSSDRILLTFQVFISHSSQDSWIAGQMGKEIEALGAKIWLDKHAIKGGDEVSKKITQGIRGSSELVVLLSPESQKSQWVSDEVGWALGQRKHVTPILHYIRPEDMMQQLRDRKAIPLNDFDSFLIELKQRIKLKERIDRKRR
ncbi:MAG TPA: toll/interleukin-1 receptor domain-containing protein [Blastocatellia bacterium]|nr:toll/interleukin-1 receptor domain-containing protein [Blastocatellia bacterium]